jgi:hypothetical protein
MSNPGLYASIYQQIREFAELVDMVLISLKSGTSQANDVSRQKLIALLTSLSATTWDSLPTRMISILLRDKDKATQQQWARLAQALSADIPDPTVITDLENLAISLEQEQTGTMTKMRGSLR